MGTLTANDRFEMKQIIGLLAEESGLPVSAIEQMTKAEAQPLFDRLMARLDREWRDRTAQAAGADSLLTLLTERRVPPGMAVGAAIDAGYLTAAEVNTAMGALAEDGLLPDDWAKTVGQRPCLPIFVGIPNAIAAEQAEPQPDEDSDIWLALETVLDLTDWVTNPAFGQNAVRVAVAASRAIGDKAGIWEIPDPAALRQLTGELVDWLLAFGAALEALTGTETS